ncbi:MAG: PilN domain-containing protein [Prosthecobacter sp.]
MESPSETSHLGAAGHRPAAACRTIGLIVPQADEELMEQIISTQLERRGFRLEQDKAGRNYRWHLLGTRSGQCIVSVDLLTDPFPEALTAAHASDYTAALRLGQLPLGHIVITEEQGDLVLAASHEGKLYHSHIFSQTPASEEALALALEITLARLTLEAELGEGVITGVALVGTGFDNSLCQRLEGAIDLPVRVVADLAPNTGLDTRSWTKMLPADIRAAQIASVTRGKVIRASILGAALYLSLAFLAFAYLHFQEQRAAALLAEIELTREPAAAVRKATERWKALAPAIDSKRYPMFLLAEINRIMPGSGIVIRDFEVRGSQIEIRGEARDAQLAVQFVADIKKNPVLSRYEWTAPNPELKGTTASFRAQGKLL